MTTSWISLNSCPLNLLHVRSQQAEIIIVKHLILGERHNYIASMQVEPRSRDQGRRKNDAFIILTTLPIITAEVNQCFFTILLVNYISYSITRMKTLLNNRYFVANRIGIHSFIHLRYEPNTLRLFNHNNVEL